MTPDEAIKEMDEAASLGVLGYWADAWAAVKEALAAATERAERAERERDALILAWPKSIDGSVVQRCDDMWWIIRAGDGRQWAGPYSRRFEAVRAAANLTPPDAGGQVEEGS